MKRKLQVTLVTVQVSLLLDEESAAASFREGFDQEVHHAWPGEGIDDECRIQIVELQMMAWPAAIETHDFGSASIVGTLERGVMHGLEIVDDDYESAEPPYRASDQLAISLPPASLFLLHERLHLSHDGQAEQHFHRFLRHAP
jgi:hypothetical protein